MANKYGFKPYCYLIGWSSLDRWYYGRRLANKTPANEDFWVGKYKTSSDVVVEYRKLYGEPDVIQIRREFDNELACRIWEEKVIDRTDAVRSERWLNASNGGRDFYRSSESMIENNPMKFPHVRKKVANTAVGILSDGSRQRVNLDDERWRTGELVHINKGKITVKDKDGNVFHTSKDDPRWESGELVHLTKGRQRTFQQIEKHRAKMKGRKWSSVMRSKREGQPAWNKGLKTGPISDETKRKKRESMLGRPQPKKCCPHCGKTGGASPMSRFHFDNCRSRG